MESYGALLSNVLKRRTRRVEFSIGLCDLGGIDLRKNLEITHKCKVQIGGIAIFLEICIVAFMKAVARSMRGIWHLARGRSFLRLLSLVGKNRATTDETSNCTTRWNLTGSAHDWLNANFAGWKLISVAPSTARIMKQILANIQMHRRHAPQRRPLPHRDRPLVCNSSC